MIDEQTRMMLAAKIEAKGRARPDLSKPARTRGLPAPDPAAVAETLRLAEERGWRWFKHGAAGTFRWWFGIGRAKQEVASIRLAVCQNCPEFDSQWIGCRKCGCSLRAKVTDAREVCPLGKW